MEHVEEFILEGKNFVYVDFSEIKTNDDLINLSDQVKPVVAKHPVNSVYMMWNLKNILFDSDSKKIVTDCMEYNKPHIKYTAVFGMDGIKKIMVSALLERVGRTNTQFTFSREQAVEWLKNQE